MHRFLPSHCDECASCACVYYCKRTKACDTTLVASRVSTRLDLQAKISPSTSREFSNSSRFPGFIQRCHGIHQVLLDIKATTNDDRLQKEFFLLLLRNTAYVWKNEGKCPSYRQSRVERKYIETEWERAMRYFIIKFRRSILEFHILNWNHEKIISEWIWKWRIFKCAMGRNTAGNALFLKDIMKCFGFKEENRIFNVVNMRGALWIQIRSRV